MHAAMVTACMYFNYTLYMNNYYVYIRLSITAHDFYNIYSVIIMTSMHA